MLGGASSPTTGHGDCFWPKKSGVVSITVTCRERGRWGNRKKGRKKEEEKDWIQISKPSAVLTEFLDFLKRMFLHPLHVLKKFVET